MLSLVVLPSADSLIASTSVWSASFFFELAPLALAMTGIFLAGVAVAAFSAWIIAAFSNLRGGSRYDDD